MAGNQPSNPQAHPSVYWVRMDWWGVLRGLILVMSSVLGMKFLYSLWAFLAG